jgi:type I restriction enzyme S subunit
MSAVTTEQKLVPDLRLPKFGDNWKTREVSELCDLIVDCVNKTAPVVEENTPYKMLRTSNIRNGKIDRFDCRRVTEETFVTWTRRSTVIRGDVILTREAPIGEVGYVDFDDSVFLGQRLMQYRASPSKLDARFLFQSFLTPGLQNQFGAHEGTGSTVSHIRVGDCSKFKIAAPTLAEQRKIAEFLTAVDGRIGQLIKKKALLEQYKKGVMQQLFAQTLRFKDDQGNPFPDWEEKKLGEVSTFINGRAYKQNELLNEGRYPVLRVGNFFTNPEWYYSDLELPEDKYCDTGDLLYAWSASFGPRVWNGGKVIYHYHIWKVMPSQNITKLFLFHLLDWDVERIKNAQGNGIAMMHITKKAMEQRPFCLPSVAEQTKIADFLSSLDRKIEQSAEQIAETQTFKRGLLQQMFV